ncbi:deuterolysin metalloprotease [Colletotrichum incanum]|nr:deuterolysin metalloprotease [Colletotrichum incanum]
MKLATTLPFVALASAATANFEKPDSPLTVNIEAVGNSGIKASLSNTGTTKLKVLKTGSILDKLAVEKAEVFAGSEKPTFEGIRLRLQTSNLPEEAFETIDAGQTIETTWDIAQVHDLSAGGKVQIVAKGFLSYAEVNSTEITGAVGFSSNLLSIEVNGDSAAKVRHEFHNLVKRTDIQKDCAGTQRAESIKALKSCNNLAATASSSAASGPAERMEEYFKSSTNITRDTVASVFAKVASECDSTTSGVSDHYCTDKISACSQGVIAYTVPSQSYIVNCPDFFTIPTLSRTCHAQDQATTTIHEVTHLLQIMGTTDQSACYGYPCVRSLTAGQNLYHADTYALFANGWF